MGSCWEFKFQLLTTGYAVFVFVMSEVSKLRKTYNSNQTGRNRTKKDVLDSKIRENFGCQIWSERMFDYSFSFFHILVQTLFPLEGKPVQGKAYYFQHKHERSTYANYKINNLYFPQSNINFHKWRSAFFFFTIRIYIPNLQYCWQL